MKLETTRLILRDYQPSDFDAVHHYSQDPDVLKYMLWGPNTREDTRSFIDQAILDGQAQPRTTFNLALMDKETKALIGGISLTLDQDQAEIGWILDRSAWGKGIATEAAVCLIRFGFDALGLSSIHATCDSENIASYKVMLKCQMTQVRIDKAARLSPYLSPALRDQRLFEITRSRYLSQYKTSTPRGDKESYGRTV